MHLNQLILHLVITNWWWTTELINVASFWVSLFLYFAISDLLLQIFILFQCWFIGEWHFQRIKFWCHHYGIWLSQRDAMILFMWSLLSNWSSSITHVTVKVFQSNGCLDETLGLTALSSKAIQNNWSDILVPPRCGYKSSWLWANELYFCWLEWF